MSKFEKLLLRLKSKPRDFTYSELKNVLTGLGYFEVNQGKTSGSRVGFINEETKHLIRLHKPHPGNILKAYQIELLLDELKKRGIIQ
ncbi:type II toxin-antitoxin system HicA family toxin [Leptospira inadai]|uniref:Type II toxin-antitoxin system HicA family toxin n=1 Tax=Leptospira inadai serovar Lyme TaxID=293084 RepID=A0ABX4YLP6_9LEPT|nr:type II toxin-antitoxin system HicA family toxin [Leptospira inadai]PNV76196.1 type II toxin-antitoxin system HicA family toxin [Leptospira inadai serovar Lyme]